MITVCVCVFVCEKKNWEWLGGEELRKPALCAEEAAALEEQTLPPGSPSFQGLARHCGSPEADGMAGGTAGNAWCGGCRVGKGLKLQLAKGCRREKHHGCLVSQSEEPMF